MCTPVSALIFDSIEAMIAIDMEVQNGFHQQHEENLKEHFSPKGSTKTRAGVINRMAKPAEAVVEDQTTDSLPDEGVDGDKLFLRQLKEEEIRAKLDEFAKELARVKDLRDAH